MQAEIIIGLWIFVAFLFGGFAVYGIFSYFDSFEEEKKRKWERILKGVLIGSIIIFLFLLALSASLTTHFI